MLRSMKELEGYAIHATDGTIGHVKDFYFDDESWVVRFKLMNQLSHSSRPPPPKETSNLSPAVSHACRARLASTSTLNGLKRLSGDPWSRCDS